MSGAPRRPRGEAAAPKHLRSRRPPTPPRTAVVWGGSNTHPNFCQPKTSLFPCSLEADEFPILSSYCSPRSHLLFVFVVFSFWNQGARIIHRLKKLPPRYVRSPPYCPFQLPVFCSPPYPTSVPLSPRFLRSIQCGTPATSQAPGQPRVSRHTTAVLDIHELVLRSGPPPPSDPARPTALSAASRSGPLAAAVGGAGAGGVLVVPRPAPTRVCSGMSTASTDRSTRFH